MYEICGIELEWNGFERAGLKGTGCMGIEFMFECTFRYIFQAGWIQDITLMAVVCWLDMR